MDFEKAKRYSLMEVVLLAVFVFGLLIAHIIVRARGQIQLSEPIELPLSGLKVSMPINSNWEHVKSWQYQSDSSLTLGAKRIWLEQNPQDPPQVQVHWKYNLCTPSGTSPDILFQRAEKDNAIMNQLEVVGEKIPMHYAQMLSIAGTSDVCFLGIARLDYGRSIELRVISHKVDPFRTEVIFRSVASSLQYEKPQALMAGKELVGGLWKQLDQNFSRTPDDTEDAFLIKDSKDNTSGFHYNQYSFFNSGKQSNCRIVNKHFIVNQMSIESTLWLEGAEQSFSWKTSIQHLGMGQPREYTVTKSQDGQIRLERNFDKDTQFQSDGALLPELLLADYIRRFLQTEQATVVVDIIAATGQVVPTKISLIEPEKASAQSEMTKTVIHVVYLNQQNSYDEFYYDADQNLIGRFERQPGQRIRLWEPTTEAQLKLLFGDMLKRTDEKVALNN